MATKTVYQTDPVSGIYLFATQANELALVPGVFNIPFGSYEDAPPAVAAGEVARRNPATSGWEVAEDHRGEVFYLVDGGAQYSLGSVVDVDGQPVSYPGWGKVPAWLTPTAPIPATGAGE
ncbi:MAG: phage tail protein [Achromobacter sp.]|uniref:phage tail protein n=1 Tax=Achromobacter pulmonis TaxID=1389932 RepID=UPI0012D1423A|nr:phage tail protein [Achromobacter pulmonis]MCF7770443.1 phage tail protein [Achromobacter pulmonis]MPT27089.1 phage tail protein [Achromobacter sp.]